MKKDVTPSESDGAPKSAKTTEQKRKKEKSKNSKANLWPLKACIITLILSVVVNVGSTLVLKDSALWVAIVLTALILLLGVLFDIIGTASTACNVEPFLAMASRKVKGAKTAVKLATNASVVSSVCNDVVGDVCGIVSGVCAAVIAEQLTGGDFVIDVLIYALISTLTITFKALGKRRAVSNANNIILFVAKILRIFNKEDR